MATRTARTCTPRTATPGRRAVLENIAGRRRAFRHPLIGVVVSGPSFNGKVRGVVAEAQLQVIRTAADCSLKWHL
jgi:hypothetical protein